MNPFMQSLAGLAAGVFLAAAVGSAASTSVSAPSAPAAPETSRSADAGLDEKLAVGYYTGWSAYSGYTPDKVPAGQLTHLHYAFAKIDAASKKVMLADPVQDEKNFAGLRALKDENPQLKTLLSVGGWDYSVYFSDAAATAESREAFAQSCADILEKYGFDGIDLDWEYPVSGGLAGNSNRPEDKQNFTLLLKAIRDKFASLGRKNGREYLLTIAGAANTSFLSKIEPQKAAGLTDYIFLMTYDMHGPWDRYADLNAPLHQPEESSPQYQNSVEGGVAAYLNSGVPAEKIVLGMPFYGYIYSGVKSQNHGLYSSYASAKSISYNQILQSYLHNDAFAKLRHPAAKVPYLYGGGAFITYEDPQSIEDKVSLSGTYGLAGAGAWELSQDKSGALWNSAYKELVKQDKEAKNKP